MTVILRGSTYHLKKRVPERFARVEPRAEVWISLKTDSASEAKDKAAAAWRQMLAS